MSAAALPADLEHRYDVVNGIRMHWVEAGSGPETILFLHGFPEQWYSWRHQIAAFAPDYRVVAPDQRGYNETEAQGPYDTDTLQQDILDLIGVLGVEKVHLVAHDWGAAIAWLVAMHHPEVLRSLVIMNVPHPKVFEKGIRRPRQMLRSWYILAFQLPWLPERAVASQDYHALARGMIRQCAPGTFTRDDIKTMLAGWRRQGLAGGINWYRAAVRRRKPLPDPVPHITLPTTIIWGENDVALGKELTDGTDAYVDRLTIHYLPGVSHWVQQEAPEQVNAFLREHLSRAGAA
ncbi:MAG: alpha/beta fold hydrolase [Tepidiformaceae bacterium]